MNRNIQVERAFAILKEEMKLRKLKVRGKNSTKREIRLSQINDKNHQFATAPSFLLEKLL